MPGQGDLRLGTRRHFNVEEPAPNSSLPPHGGIAERGSVADACTGEARVIDRSHLESRPSRLR